MSWWEIPLVMASALFIWDMSHRVQTEVVTIPVKSKINLTRLAMTTKQEEFKSLAEEAKQDSPNTFDSIRAAVKTMPPEQGETHRFLIQFARDLNVRESDKIEFMEEQILANSGSLTQVIALDTLMDISDDVPRIEKLVAQALEANPNSPVRETLLSRFAARYPERESYFLRQ